MCICVHSTLPSCELNYLLTGQGLCGRGDETKLTKVDVDTVIGLSLFLSEVDKVAGRLVPMVLGMELRPGASNFIAVQVSCSCMHFFSE